MKKVTPFRLVVHFLLRSAKFMKKSAPHNQEKSVKRLLVNPLRSEDRYKINMLCVSSDAMDFKRLFNISNKIGFVNSGPQVCVGHSLAVVRGHKVESVLTTDIRRQRDPNQLDAIKQFIANDVPENKGLEILILEDENISLHATSLYILKTATTTYVWYNNPWGFEFDNEELFEQSKLFFQKYKESSWYSRIAFDQYAFGTLQQFMIDANLTNSERRIYDAKKLRSSMKTANNYFPPEYVEWESGERVNKTKDDAILLCPEHILSIIFLLKLKFGKKHIKVFHPSVSMKFEGPQIHFDDGFARHDKEFRKRLDKLSVDIGTCVVWQELYATHAALLIGEAMSDSVKIDDVKMEKILVKLKRNQLLGEQQAKQTLGKFMFALTPDGWIKDLLTDLFPLLPDEAALRADDGNSVYKYYANLTFALDMSVKASKKLNPMVPFKPADTMTSFLGFMVLNKDHRARVASLVKLKNKEIKRFHDKGDFYLLPQCAFILLGCKHSNYFRDLREFSDVTLIHNPYFEKMF